MSVYDKMKNGASVVWNDLDEQGKYEVWSRHCEEVGDELGYIEFCNRLDNQQIGGVG